MERWVYGRESKAAPGRGTGLQEAEVEGGLRGSTHSSMGAGSGGKGDGDLCSYFTFHVKSVYFESQRREKWMFSCQ